MLRPLPVIMRLWLCSFACPKRARVPARGKRKPGKPNILAYSAIEISRPESGNCGSMSELQQFRENLLKIACSSWDYYLTNILRLSKNSFDASSATSL